MAEERQVEARMQQMEVDGLEIDEDALQSLRVWGKGFGV